MELSVPKNEILIDKNKISMRLDNDTLYSMNINQLEKFYCLYIGSEVLANDSTCYLLIFNDKLWLIPDSTYGAHNLRTWIEPLIESDKIIIGQIDHLPFKWRAKRFFFGLEAQLAIKDLKQFNEMEPRISILHDANLDEIF